MIRLLDLPGVKELEARLELLPHLSPSNDDRCRDLLGSAASAFGLSVEWWGGIELPPLPDDWDNFDIEAWSSLDFWRAKGWDIAGPDGRALRCMAYLERALAAVIEGRAPLSTMEIEAALWRSEREREPVRDAKSRALNDNFLSLGESRRRRFR